MLLWLALLTVACAGLHRLSSMGQTLHKLVLYNLHCTLYNLHLILYNAHCSLYNMHNLFAKYTVYFKINTLYSCTLYRVDCTLKNVHCTLYIVHCTLYTRVAENIFFGIKSSIFKSKMVPRACILMFYLSPNLVVYT